MSNIVYFIGGPADLTKMVVQRIRSRDTLRFAITEPLRLDGLRGDEPFDMDAEAKLNCRCALYEIYPPMMADEAGRDVFFAKFKAYEGS